MMHKIYISPTVGLAYDITWDTWAETIIQSPIALPLSTAAAAVGRALVPKNGGLEPSCRERTESVDLLVVVE